MLLLGSHQIRWIHLRSQKFVDDFGEILHHQLHLLLITIGTTFGIQVGQVMKTNSCHHLQVQILVELQTPQPKSIQEIRYYKKKLSGEVIDGHAKNREEILF